jgi:cell division septal protein FtsQ
MPFLNRKQQNRRLGRDYVLDVKLRSSKLRAARARALVFSTAIAVGTLFGLYVLWRSGDWLITKLIYENKSFAIQEIDAQTDGVIGSEQLARWAGVRVGQNLLALDLARVKRDLELIPLVQTASVERVLPHTLRLRVFEREAIAQASLPRQKPGGGFEFTILHLDSDGYVMVPLEARQKAKPANNLEDQLPVLYGINSNELQPGRRMDEPQIRAALQLIIAFDHSPMAGLAEIKRLDLAAPEVITATTDQNLEVTFGLKDIDKQLRRWRAIYDEGQRVNKGIAAIDLAMADNIPVRLTDASALPPSVSKSPKILRTRKKHV